MTMAKNPWYLLFIIKMTIHVAAVMEVHQRFLLLPFLK